MSGTTYVCPNCGANITNRLNCEYCGSLLVRFVDKGIDLSKTAMLNDEMVYPGMVDALRRNILMQDNCEEAVTTDFYIRNAHGVREIIPGSVLRTGFSVWPDGNPLILSQRKDKRGLVVAFGFSQYENPSSDRQRSINRDDREALDRFRKIDSYPLFTQCECIVKDTDGVFKHTGYAVDFGEDAEGAAKILSEVYRKVRLIPEGVRLECYTNQGVKIDESRRIYSIEESRRVDDESGDDGGIPWWVYAAGAGLVLYFLFS